MVLKRYSGFFIFTLIILIAGESNCTAQTSKRKINRIEKSIAGSKRRVPRDKKTREPRSVSKAKRQQEARAARLERDYTKAVKANRKRHLDIQTEDVQARMKQNEKDIRLREREKRKREREAARKSGSARKKYKN